VWLIPDPRADRVRLVISDQKQPPHSGKKGLDMIDMADQLYITWEHWHNLPEDTTKSISKAHAPHREHEDMTLCGLRIPPEGNGIVHEHVSTNRNDSCKRCERAIEREEREEAKRLAADRAGYDRRVQAVLKAANCDDWQVYTDCRRVGGYAPDLLVVTKVVTHLSGTKHEWRGLECKMIGGKSGIHSLGVVGKVGDDGIPHSIDHGRIRAHWDGYSTMGN